MNTFTTRKGRCGLFR